MKTRQGGVAIVLAMGVVALAAMTATALMTSQSTWARQVELNASHVQAQLLIQAGLDWARAVLSDDRRASSVDTLSEPWALRLPPIPVENGSLAGHIEDQQGKFNLNNLFEDGKVNLAQLAHFRRLLAVLSLPPALADALVDWTNQPLLDIAELALVRGFDDAVRTRLRPFVTALPGFTAINVNTASPEVISALVDGLQLDPARAIVSQRERIYFRNEADFSRRLPQGLVASKEDVAVSSDYFIATTQVSIGGAQARGSALLARTNAGWPAVVWRKLP